MLHGPAGLDPVKHMTFGVTRFMDSATTPKVLLGMLSLVSIFSIWQAVVWAIGVSVVTGISRGKAAVVAVCVWLLTGIPAIVGAIVGGAGGGPGVQVQVE